MARSPRDRRNKRLKHKRLLCFVLGYLEDHKIFKKKSLVAEWVLYENPILTDPSGDFAIALKKYKIHISNYLSGVFTYLVKTNKIKVFNEGTSKHRSYKTIPGVTLKNLEHYIENGVVIGNSTKFYREDYIRNMVGRPAKPRITKPKIPRDQWKFKESRINCDNFYKSINFCEIGPGYKPIDITEFKELWDHPIVHVCNVSKIEEGG